MKTIVALRMVRVASLLSVLKMIREKIVGIDKNEAFQIMDA